MPSESVVNPAIIKVARSDSLRSQQSDDSKRVSFNQDVRVKRIPKSKLAAPPLLDPVTRPNEFGPFAEVRVEEPPANAKEIEAEAELILRQLQGIECRVNGNEPVTVNNKYSSSKPIISSSLDRRHHLNSLDRRPTFGSSPSLNNRVLLENRRNVSAEPPAMRISVPRGHSAEPRSHSSSDANPLYGLHALNNLDIAVNGKDVNTMPSYHEIRRRGNSVHNLDSSGNSAEYSPPPYKRNNISPPKPPRKAPSQSPPSLRKMAASPASLMDQLSQDARFKRRLIESTSGEDSMLQSDSAVYSSHSTSGPSPPARFVRKSPPRHPSPSRLSPSRTCMTDTELLRSPSEVLYAVSDKHRHNNNEHTVHSASQTMQSELMGRSRTSSREDILSERPRYRPAVATKPVMHSRSLERFIDGDDNKENTYKTRILVTSPDRYSPDRPINRKPYKTTINTATDNIQYRGEQDRLRYARSNQSNARPDTEHYKVPRNKTPVTEHYIMRANMDNNYHTQYHYDPPPRSSSNGRSQFQSTRLVKNVTDNFRHHQNGRELDREGRSIAREPGTGRARAYSGASSTSPDRDGSPSGYAKPRGVPVRYHNNNRSPSSSPTRPPRSRSSPAREMMREQQQVRRVSSRREVDRSPSTRASTAGRSPIKEIKRVHNDLRGKRAVSRSSSRHYDNDEERLSRFTEYRGDEVSKRSPSLDNRRASYGYELRKQQQQQQRESDIERERGRSLPPGATIDSIRDFYKSSQYKSMYALPPSPNRPAPVLDRNSSTLRRETSRDRLNGHGTRRPTRTSISEGEVTDDTARHETRHATRGGQRKMNGGKILVGRAPSTKRQAPSPPVGKVIRRVVSSDREDQSRNGNGNVRRVVSSERGLQHPPQRRPVNRRSSVDVLDSSYSESEGLNGENEQEKPLGEFGRRWTAGVPPPPSAAEMDSDYRRDLATNGGGGTALHQEARSRDGGPGWSTAGRRAQSASISRRDEDHSPGHSAREEERRKVLEIEREAQVRRAASAGSAAVHRSGSRVAGMRTIIRPGKRVQDIDHDSQYSGHSSSSAMPPPSKAGSSATAPPGIKRYDQNRTAGRIKRSTSNATSSVGGVRREIRKKMPGSVTSSINSSESEQGNANRSVFLHSAAVADMNMPAANKPEPPRHASRENLLANPGSNLQKSKKISRSISLLAPWKPKNYKDKFEIHYDNGSAYGGSNAGKPPRPPPSRGPARHHPASQRDKMKSASSSDLLREEESPPHIILSQQPPRPHRQSKAVSRSVSMPKDSRLAGWFKKRKRV